MIKVKLKGAKVLANKFGRASKKIEDVYRVIDEESDLLKQRSVNKAPVDTGELRASAFKNELSGTSNYGYEIGFEKKYVPYQEFGTRNKFSLSAEYKEFDKYALQFKVLGPARNDKGGNKPKRYFFHYYIIARRAVVRKSNTIIKNLIK